MTYRSPAREPLDVEADPYERELAGRARAWRRAFIAAKVLAVVTAVIAGAVLGRRVWQVKALEQRLRADVAREERPRRLSGLDALYGEAIPRWVRSFGAERLVRPSPEYERWPRGSARCARSRRETRRSGRWSSASTGSCWPPPLRKADGARRGVSRLE